ncbi:MAG: nucleotidyltransferase family protein [Woeseiaceae bacterium]
MTSSTRQRSPRVYIAVLAAGQSRRFGANKLLQHWQGETLLRRALNAACAACGARTLLVTGHDHLEISNAAAPFPGFIAHNADFAAGIGTSIATAAAALQHVADAILIVLADQPLVSSEHLAAMMAAWSGDPRQVIASRYAGIVGAPVLLPAGTFRELLQLRGDIGARAILRDDRFTVQSLDFEPAALDVDTPEDLEQRSQLTQPESPST